jgi:glycosyltransferase involved in cell wall biosynthesis
VNSPSICLICHEYPPEPQGGIGTFTQIVSRGLVAAGWRVRVVGFRSQLYSGPDQHDDHGVQVFRLRRPSRDLASVRTLARLYRRVSAWARGGDIDLLELPDAQGWAAGWPRLPIPVVTRVHGSATYFARELGRPVRRLEYWRERLSIRRSDVWCAVSEYSARKTQQIFDLQPPRAISYVPVHLPAEVDRLGRTRNRVVYTGTLTLKKGIGCLLRAWPEVLRRVPEAELHIYGKEIARGSQTMTESLLTPFDAAIRSTIHFHGHCARPEVLNALRTSRVAVFPSYAEAFAFAPMESMASGCPTIYSVRTSGPELMRHNENGLLIDPDQPEDIAAAVVSVLQDDGLAERLGKAGRKRVGDSFTADRLLPQMELFYRHCISEFAIRTRSAVRVSPACQ